MRDHSNILSLGAWCLLAAAASTCAGAQVPAHPDESASCRRFAQAFYDWYLPVSEAPLKEPASNLALRKKPDVFAADLLRALKADSDAQARVKDDLVGLDFDPFLGSQDPDHRYQARRVTWQDNRCSVEIWSASAEAARSGKPDVVAQLKQEHGRWQFFNFRYPEQNADLVTVLAQLREEREKTAVKRK